MKLSKQVINLIGIVVVAAVLIAGIALIAVPMVGQAQATASQARTVQQGNAIYEQQIAQLTAAQQEQAQLDADTAALQAEIPASTQFDDVFEIAITAATEHELTIDSVTISEPEPWAARTTIGEGAEVDSAPAPDPAAEAGAEGAAAAGEAAQAPASSEGDAATTPRQQAAVKITVPAPDLTRAAAFVDSLQSGLRLVNPVSFGYADGILTATVFTFIRTED